MIAHITQEIKQVENKIYNISTGQQPNTQKPTRQSNAGAQINLTGICLGTLNKEHARRFRAVKRFSINSPLGSLAPLK